MKHITLIAVLHGMFILSCGEDDSTMPDSGSDLNSDSDTDADTDTDTDTDTGTNNGLVGGDVLPDAEAGKWKWVKFKEAYCRNSSKAGLAVRYSDTSNNLLIFLEGGGGCFNYATCLGNPRSIPVSARTPDTRGIFDFAEEENPVRDWNMIYIPYCTGDAHFGSNPNGNIAGHGKQKFVGGDNYRLFLKSILATFLDTERVILSGYSAGSIGAAANLYATLEAFGDGVSVTAICDAAVIMREKYSTLCLQNIMSKHWGIEELLPDDCEGCFPSQGGKIHEFYAYVAAKYSKLTVGLLSSLEDATMRTFFGYGLNNCNVTIPSYPGEMYQEGLEDMRDYFDELGFNGGTFYYPGTEHGKLRFDEFYTLTVNGVAFLDWFNSVVAEEDMTHVCPD